MIYRLFSFDIYIFTNFIEPYIAFLCEIWHHLDLYVSLFYISAMYIIDLYIPKSKVMVLEYLMIFF